MSQPIDRKRQIVALWRLIIAGVVVALLAFGWKLFVHSLPIGTEYMQSPSEQLHLHFTRDIREGWILFGAWQALSPEAKAKISSTQLAAAGASFDRIAKLFHDAQLPPPRSGKLTILQESGVIYSVTEDMKIHNITIIPPPEFTIGPRPMPRPSLARMPPTVIPPPPRACAALQGLTVQDCAALGTLAPEALSEQALLKASNTRGQDGFGTSVAIWGDTVVVGATHARAAYVFVRSGTTWSLQGYLTASNPATTPNFGSSVAIWGNTVVVAANGSGVVSVFTRTGTTWSGQSVLQTAKGGTLGTSIAIWDDTIVVGARSDSSAAVGVNGDATEAPDAGAAYVFARTGTAWNEQAYLKASNTKAHDRFGTSVAVCGDMVVIGAPGAGSGAAYVFRRTGTTWSNQAYLKAPTTRLDAEFGSSVAVWGDTIVVGAKRERSAATGAIGDHTDTSLTDAGAAYIFGWRGTTWTQEAYLRASTVRAHDRFGWSVAIWDDAVAVGALDSPDGGGAISVFRRDGTTWNEQAILKAPPTEAQGFGRSVAISGDTMISGPASLFVGTTPTSSP